MFTGRSVALVKPIEELEMLIGVEVKIDFEQGPRSYEMPRDGGFNRASSCRICEKIRRRVPDIFRSLLLANKRSHPGNNQHLLFIHGLWLRTNGEEHGAEPRGEWGMKNGDILHVLRLC